jgi:hypothetical protein
MAKSVDIVPIYDKDAEGMVIGSVILDPSCLDGVDLDPEDFFVENYQHLWKAILSLQDRSAEINSTTVSREAKVETWVLQQVAAEALPIEVLHYADIVKEMSRQRKLVGAVERVMQEFRKKRFSSRDLADQLQLCLDTLDFPTNSSRVVTIANPRIVEAYPPTYELDVSTTNGKASASVKVTSAELDKPLVFRRKVREHLKINPLLPKQFDAFVHQVLQQAKTVPGAGDASTDESICYWIKEWFTAASEAEHYEDLTQAYREQDGAYWFSVERLLNYVSERSKVKLDRSSLWSVIHNRGGKRSKVFRFGDKTTRLWGIDKSFFEEEEPADKEQLTLEPEPVPPEDRDDFKWLEG